MLWLFKKSVSLSNALRAVGSFLSSTTKQCGILRPSSFRGSTSSFTAPAWSSARHARFLIKTWTHEFESDPDSQPWTVFESLFCHMFLIKTWTHEFESDPDSQPWTVFESLFCHMKKHQAFYEVLHATGRDNVLRTSLREKIGLTQELANEEAYRKTFFADGISGWIEEWIERGMPDTRRAERITETLC